MTSAVATLLLLAGGAWIGRMRDDVSEWVAKEPFKAKTKAEKEAEKAMGSEKVRNFFFQ